MWTDKDDKSMPEFSSQDVDYNAIRNTCETRWVERHDAIMTFVQLYPSILACVERCQSLESNSASKACMFGHSIRTRVHSGCGCVGECSSCNVADRSPWSRRRPPGYAEEQTRRQLSVGEELRWRREEEEHGDHPVEVVPPNQQLMHKIAVL